MSTENKEIDSLIFNDTKAEDFYDFIKKIEEQNKVIEKQNKELESMIAYITEENVVLERSIKEIIGKENGANWINTLCKK
ncbi:hypothetical protein BDAP_000231 [Binucleata daphniae]